MPTGNISHFSKPEEFDNVDQILKVASATDVFWVPGEHDAPNDDGKSYLERYRNNGKGAGWCSFDKKGVHFVGLVNGMNLNSGDSEHWAMSSYSGSKTTLNIIGDGDQDLSELELREVGVSDWFKC